VVDGSAESVQTKTKLFVVASTDQGPIMKMVATYHDYFVNEAGAWRLALRRVSTD
jgi:hypothetical protein